MSRSRNARRPGRGATVERPEGQPLGDGRAKKGEGDLDALLHAGDTWAIS